MNDDSWQPHFRFPARWARIKNAAEEIKNAAEEAKSLFCSGPERSPVSKIEIRGSVLLCPWPVEEQRQNKHYIYLEDGSGKELDSVALQEPDMFQPVSAIRDDGVCDIFEDHRRGLSGV